MNKSFVLLLAFIFLTLSLSLPVFAHPGKTDENGGHYDHSTGEYHYHHGYPAHQHYGGNCPYDFDDQTGKDTSPSLGSSSPSSSGSEASSQSSKDWELVWGLIAWGGLISFFVYLGVTYRKKETN